MASTKAISLDEGLRQGVTTYQGHITSQPVATGLERDFTPIDELVLNYHIFKELPSKNKLF